MINRPRRNLILIYLLAFNYSLSAEPFSLKNDTLGMSLSEFQNKYKRAVPTHNQSAPYCTGEFTEIAKAMSEEIWHFNAGIIHCTTHFGFEYARKLGPSIVNEKVKSLTHHFVDNKLFKITALLNHNSFHVVHLALSEKYGNPNDASRTTYTNSIGVKVSGLTSVWVNKDSKITITERYGMIDTSKLEYEHKSLSELVASRKPAPYKGDI